MPVHFNDKKINAVTINITSTSSILHKCEANIVMKH